MIAFIGTLVSVQTRRGSGLATVEWRNTEAQSIDSQKGA